MYYKIQLHIGTPNNPNSMGIVERFHLTITEIYRIAKYQHKITDASSVMTYAIMAYNNTIHSASELSPFKVTFGRTNSTSTFDTNNEYNYTQQLLREHKDRTSVLYNYISQKMTQDKINRQKPGESKNFSTGDIIYTGLVNKRRGKDKPRFEQAQVVGDTTRNFVPIKIKDRVTKVPVRNVKRPTKW